MVIGDWKMIGKTKIKQLIPISEYPEFRAFCESCEKGVDDGTYIDAYLKKKNKKITDYVGEN